MAIGTLLGLGSTLAGLFGKKKAGGDSGILNFISSLTGGEGGGGGFFQSPGGAAAISALGGLAGGIGAGFGSASERKWQEKMLGKQQDWQEQMRTGEWEHEAGLRGELEKRLAPTTGYIGMAPGLQGDVTRAIMGQAQRYLGEDIMKKYGIDVGGYFSGEKLAKPELPYMYREEGAEPTGGTASGGGTRGGTRPGREDERNFMRRNQKPRMI